MAYQGLNLGDIYAQAMQIKGTQQRQAMGDLQLQDAQRQMADQQGIDAAIQANPNVSSTDLAGKFGMAGIDAGQKLSAARIADLTDHYRQTYLVASEAANSENPLAVIQQKAPQFIQQYDQVHGQGSFAQLAQDPNALRQQAAKVAEQSMAGLVDPGKQWQAHQDMALAHFKEGQQNARTTAEIASRQQVSQATQSAENTRAAASRAVTMRGQDLANADRGIPSGYERDPANPGSLRPIAGGPHDPNATAAGMDSRSAVMFNRVASSANEAVQAIKNIAELPITTSTGWFGSAESGKSLFDSAKSVLAQKVTSQEAQDLKTMIAGVSRSLSTIETAGLAPNGSITHSMDSITIGEGDSQMTKLRKMAEMRQIVEKGIEPQLSNPKLGPAQRQLIEGIISQVQEAIPFTQHDITQLQRSKNPQATIMDFAKQTGLPTAAPTVAPAAHPANIQALLDKYK